MPKWVVARFTDEFVSPRLVLSAGRGGYLLGMAFSPVRVTVGSSPTELLMSETDRVRSPGASLLIKVLSGSVLLGVETDDQANWFPLDAGEIYSADYERYDSLKAVSTAGAQLALMRSGI